jgi:hypothetical protein
LKGLAAASENIAMPHCNERENIGIDFTDCAEFRFVTEKWRRDEYRHAATSSPRGPVSVEQIQPQKKPSFFGL